MTKVVSLKLRLHLGRLDGDGIGRARVLLAGRLIAEFDTTRAEFRLAAATLKRTRISPLLAAKAEAEATRRQTLGRTYHWAA